jgi:hypothetical protein
MTYQEINSIINSELFYEHDHEPARWMYEDVYSSANKIEEEGEFKEEFKKLGKFEMVEEFGGEGQGDDYYAVYHFIDHDVYIKFQGWYASHRGSEYEEMYEVRPEQVTKTEYNRV